MFSRFILWASLIISWLSAFMIGKEKIRRFMPVAIFASLLVTFVYVISYHLRWFKINKPSIPWLKATELTYILGPFLVGTIWVYSVTYRFGFRVYMIANFILDSFFSYIFLPFLEKTGTVTLMRITRTGINGLMLVIAVLIYPFQKWQDGKPKKWNSLKKR